MVIIFVLVLVTLVSCLYILCQIGSKFSSLDHCQLESMLTELFVLCQDGEPCRVGVALIDLSTGLYTILAILSALEHRHKTNTGQHVQCNLLSTQVRVCNAMQVCACTRHKPADIVQLFSVSYTVEFQWPATLLQKSVVCPEV